MTTPPITVTGLTPRQIDRDTKTPITIDVTASPDYDLTDANIAFAFPTTRQRPDTWQWGHWTTEGAQQATAQSRPVTLTAGTRDVYARIKVLGHTHIVLAGRLHVA